MTRRKKETPAPKTQLTFNLNPELWKQVVAIALIAIAVIILLSLVTSSRGPVTESLIQGLQFLVGWGVVLAPIWLVAFGIYLFLDSLNKIPNIGLERPVGAAMLYLVALALIHLIALGATSVRSSDLVSGSGGVVGAFIGDVLTAAVGDSGAYVVLTALACVGIIFLLHLSLGDLIGGYTVVVSRLRGQQMIPGVRINTPGSRSAAPIPLVPSLPLNKGDARREELPPPRGSTRDKPGAKDSKDKKSVVVIGRADEPAPPLPPMKARVIGGEQHEWALPSPGTVLEAQSEQELSQAEIRDRVKIIEQTLAHFGVPARVVEVSQGPTVTQFGVEPGFTERKSADGQSKQVKVKVSAIAGLANDLALALAASPIRIEAPIPGRAMVGIEVPNSQSALVNLRSVVESETYVKMESPLKIALGQDVSGQAIVADLGLMPHLLIAGATGSGKSVCINALIACMLMNNKPNELNFVMVDPKMVELVTYNGTPHLVMPVITEVDKVVNALNWALSEMDRRYRLFAKSGVRNIEGYNQYLYERNEPKLPYLIIIIDELADLMMSRAEECERSICRLAQMARATGIHLILATQRPSVDVVTGLIKANFPARIAFAVTTQVDSRVILDTVGAEKLLGRGDMLYMSSDSSKLVRLQGCWVSDDELRRLVQYWRSAAAPEGALTPRGGDEHSMSGVLTTPTRQQPLWEDVLAQQKQSDGRDELLDKAIEVVQQHGRASVSLLQRKLRIGYQRAARLIDLMETEGIVGPMEEPGRERKILIRGSTPASSREWEEDEA